MADEEREEQKPLEMEVISASALEHMQRAEIDMQIATARKFPRPSLSMVKKKMESFATLDEETAESCFYTLPRDGKNIQGPSVRLAEIAVACYGNIRAASRVIENNGRVVTSQGACHDLENNTLISVEVKRRITDKKGRTYSDDMQVTTGNAASSIAFRNAVFKVIPMALIKPVYDAVKAVAIGKASTLVAKRDKFVKRLNAMGVATPRILQTLGRAAVEDVDLEDLGVLIGLGNAIKDGDTSVDEAFPVQRKEHATVNVNDFKPSEDPNRGHDGANPENGKTEEAKTEPKLEVKPEPTKAEPKPAAEAAKAATENPRQAEPAQTEDSLAKRARLAEEQNERNRQQAAAADKPKEEKKEPAKGRAPGGFNF